MISSSSFDSKPAALKAAAKADWESNVDDASNSDEDNNPMAKLATRKSDMQHDSSDSGNDKKRAASSDSGNDKKMAASSDSGNDKKRAASSDSGNDKKRTASSDSGNDKKRAASSDSSSDTASGDAAAAAVFGRARVGSDFVEEHGVDISQAYMPGSVSFVCPNSGENVNLMYKQIESVVRICFGNLSTIFDASETTAIHTIHRLCMTPNTGIGFGMSSFKTEYFYIYYLVSHHHPSSILI